MHVRLVELIVLNVGLSAGILTPVSFPPSLASRAPPNGPGQRVFSMFVLEALTLTCLTTPLVSRFYPPHVRRRITASGIPFGNVANDEGVPNKVRSQSEDASGPRKQLRMTVVLDRLEHLPGAMS